MESKKIRMHFSKQTINQAVSDVESGISRREVCAKYGVSNGALIDWIDKYASSEHQATRRRVISDREKRDTLAAIHQGRMTVREAGIAHRIDIHTIRRWVRQSKTEVITPPTPMVESNAETLTLQKELASAQLKIRALETLIDVAEDTLKIKIRKKSGAKQ